MATRNIVPNTNNAGAIGLDAKRWAFGHFQVLKQSGKDVATTDQLPVVPITSVNGKVGSVVLSPSDVGAATAAQGAKADTASQPGHTHNQYSEIAAALSNNPSSARSALGLGSAALSSADAFATAAQGAKADTASQPGHTHNQYSEIATALANNPSSARSALGLGSAALSSADAFAAAAHNHLSSNITDFNSAVMAVINAVLAAGLVFRSPDNSQWKLTIDNDGLLTTTPL